MTSVLWESTGCRKLGWEWRRPVWGRESSVRVTIRGPLLGLSQKFPLTLAQKERFVLLCPGQTNRH